MKRKITDILLKWKQNPAGLALLIHGARQVGKTYILNDFGVKYYANKVYIKFFQATALHR